MIMKKSLTMALTVVVASAMFFVTSCNKSDNPVTAGGGLADQNLVGVWWVTSGSGGTQILADGTLLPLTAYGGKIAVDTAAAKQFTGKITASNGTGTYTETSKSSFTGKDTTVNHPFTYVLSNSNNNLSVTQNDDAGTPVTTAYTRKNIGDAASGGLVATPNSVTVVKGSNATVTISGGTTPYTIQTVPNSSVATATISGATLSVTGLAAGSTSVIVKDNSSPAKTVTVAITVTATAAALTANPTSVTVAIGSTATVTISGGTTPYTIQTAPTSTVATATISGATLSVTGVDAGSTSVIVKDNSSPAKTLTVAITVTTSGSGFTTAGTLSFTSDKGNFSASGIFDPNATTGSGAGAMILSSGGSNTLTVYGFRANSATSYDLVLALFMDSDPIATGSYTYPPTTGSKLVMISYFPAVNPNDTSATESFYLLSTATANISAVTSSNAQGTFSGNGMYFVNSTPNYSQTISMTGGTFNVPVIPGGSANTVNNKIEGIVKRIVSLQKH